MFHVEHHLFVILDTMWTQFVHLDTNLDNVDTTWTTWTSFWTRIFRRFYTIDFKNKKTNVPRGTLL